LALDQYTFDAIAFNAAGRFEFNPMRDEVHLVYEIDRNVFKGNVNLQLRIVHLNQ
jgi:single-stranded-DNA-specific exonuclease